MAVLTPFMRLTLPTPGVDPGIGWATSLVTDFNAVDSHDHTVGKGVPVPTAGMNINADLPFNGVNLNAVRSVRFQVIPGALPGPGLPDAGCIYFSGVDAYINDLAGGRIRITSGGGLAGTPGSIAGLLSPAAATYIPASLLFSFTSSSGVRAYLEAGPLSIFDPVLGGQKVTVSVPSGLTASYGVKLWGGLPAAQKIVTLDSVGQLAAVYDVDNASLQIVSNQLSVRAGGIQTTMLADASVTQAKRAALGQQVSAASGFFISSAAGLTDVPGLSVTLTTTGRPVILMLIGDGGPTTFVAGINVTGNPPTLAFVRDGGVISQSQLFLFSAPAGQGVEIPPGAMSHLDVPAAAPHVYKLQAASGNASNTIVVSGCKLAAYEM